MYRKRIITFHTPFFVGINASLHEIKFYHAYIPANTNNIQPKIHT